MAIRDLVIFPDDCLRRPTKDITQFDAELHALIDDMFDTMYHARGVGLAAPQIGLSLNLAVIDVTADKSQQLVLANPEIIAAEGEQDYQEGCLSVPKVYDTVKRSAKVTMRAQDKFGEFYELSGDGLLGEAIQHEIDHLNSKLFIDLLSPLKRQRLRKQMEKIQRADRKKKG